MNLWNQKLTRRELEGFTGDLRQVADIQLARLDDGPERDVRVAYVRTGSGFDFTVLLDRAMDIGTATYNGIPLAWQSGTGAAHPSRYEPTGLGWLHGFHGGLLALCGLTNVGFNPDTPTDPETGEALNLHGRINHIPAQDIRIERVWDENGQLSLHLKGNVDEIRIFRHRLRLERTLSFTAGSPAFQVQDRVRNMGGTPAPLMILYHCNLGWPLIAPDSEFISPAKNVTPRDAVAEPGLGSWHKMQAPTPGYAEQVFFHEVDPSETPVTAKVVNRSLGLSLEIQYDSKMLNCLTEWKQMGFGDYTLGIEPGNCYPLARVAERQAGRLRMLPPGETDVFTIGFRVIPSH
jgi:hypothetical protein